jgi:electron transport complex protein RnfG
MKKILSLVLSLTVISAVCAGVLAYVNSVTEGSIKATKEKNVLRAAGEVMPEGVASVEAAAWADEAKSAQVAFVGRAADGSVAGYAVKGADSGGYGGDIELMVGFAPDRKTVVRYKTLAAAETPGLGMKLKDPSFAGQFAGRDGTGLAVKKDGGEIEAITSATITSRAVCRAIADACARAASL